MSRHSLTFADLRNANVTRCARWHPGGVNDWSLSRWGIATAGELGEACNVVKKLNRHRDGLAGNAAEETETRLLAHLGEELADTVHYLVLFAEAAGIDLELAIIAKFNRVSEKHGFPDRLPLPSVCGYCDGRGAVSGGRRICPICLGLASAPD